MAEGTRGLAPWVSLAVALGVGVVTACHGAETKSSSAAPNAQAQSPPAPEAKLFSDLGSFHRKVTTSNAQAQQYFDQGLLFCFAFNHEEAIRSFRKAAELDPKCAMAWWGAALAAGPHINNPTMDEAATKAASEAVAQARALAAGASAVEKDLIEALSKRYVLPPPADRAALDRAYADAMREVWRRHGNDADVGALFAESMLDVRPWDQWTKDGQPQPGTEEITATLAQVLELVPDHVGGLHYSIHAWEASKTPERALPAADKLRHRVPGAGHVVHMPAHIDMRVGHYQEAIAANERAIAADLKYVEYAGRMNFYSIYRAHNYHFLAWAATFDGQSGKAIEAARALVREMPSEFVAQMPDFIEAFLATPYHVLVRFGRWKEILAEPEPPAGQPATAAFRHYARAMAYSSLRQVDDAGKELDAFRAAAAKVPPTATLANNPVSALVAIALPLAEGEVEYRRGHRDMAFDLLREAVKRDDALKYDEPWGWMQPARHALGALLLEQGRVEEAEAVYREDLKRHPANGWSLHGLAECLERRGKTAEAQTARAEFEKAWQRADTKLTGSCFCRVGG
jgi:tetratricopeptide (TPR) repeat protein